MSFTDWQGWELLDAYEQQLGSQWGPLPSGGTRERVKVISRKKMMEIAAGEDVESLGLASGEDWAADPFVGEPGELGSPTAPQRFEDFTGPNS